MDVLDILRAHHPMMERLNVYDIIESYTNLTYISGSKVYCTIQFDGYLTLTDDFANYVASTPLAQVLTNVDCLRPLLEARGFTLDGTNSERGYRFYRSVDGEKAACNEGRETPAA
jgi:hypothetical protein